MINNAHESTGRLDLLLKGGTVIDPANGINRPIDIGIAGGKITRLAPSIPSGDTVQTLDVSGLLVTPGILDIHSHVYLFRTSAKNYVEGVNADAHLFSAGVTTTVDAGTAGWKMFWDFKENIIDRARVRILAFLNIAGNGMMDDISEQTLADMNPAVVASMAQAYPEIIVGIKTAHYWTNKPWDELHPPWASVERAVEAGELCGKPVMVDFWPRPPERPYPDLILKKLRPGDFHTHVFAQQFPIVSADGKASDFLFEARRRGVRFDLGHGAGSFWFRNAVPALRDGFPPDTISTDLHMGNINGPVISMLTTMSKCLCMGMPLEEVIQRSTVLPAQLIGHPELGTLSAGGVADVAVFKLLEGNFGYTDCGKAKIIGSQKLECKLTLRDGQIVYDPDGMSMPQWEQAPEAYWKMPDLQV
jgi:dihydroorotase